MSCLSTLHIIQMKNFGSFSAGSNIFSTGTVPYLPIITDRSPLLPATGRRGDGYFSGWKIIRRLPQALKWAALRLRTIIIISSDGLGSEVKKDESGGGGETAKEAVETDTRPYIRAAFKLFRCGSQHIYRLVNVP